MQKEKDRDDQAEDARDAPRDAAEAALAQAQAAAAAAAARRLTPSAAAAEHVTIAAMKRAAEFVKVSEKMSGIYSPALQIIKGLALSGMYRSGDFNLRQSHRTFLDSGWGIWLCITVSSLARQ